MTSPRLVSSIQVNVHDLYFDQLPADLRAKMAGHQAIAEAWIEHARSLARRTSAGASDHVSARGGAVSIHDVTDNGRVAARPGATFTLSGNTRPAMAGGPLQVRVSLPGEQNIMVPVRPDGSWSATVRVPAELQGRDVQLRVDVPTTTHGEIYTRAGVDLGSALVSLQAEDAYFTKTLTLTRAPALSIDLAQVRDPELRRALTAYDTVRRKRGKGREIWARRQMSLASARHLKNRRPVTSRSDATTFANTLLTKKPSSFVKRRGSLHTPRLGAVAALSLAISACSSRPAECDDLEACCAKLDQQSAALCRDGITSAESNATGEQLANACRAALDTFAASSRCDATQNSRDGGQRETPARDPGLNSGGTHCNVLDACCAQLESSSALGCIQLSVQYRSAVGGDEACRRSAEVYSEAGQCVLPGKPGPEVLDVTCADGVDNDGNGFTDCLDFSCSWNPLVTVCAHELTNAECTDGIDNDRNGFVDCADFSCSRSGQSNVCR